MHIKQKTTSHKSGDNRRRKKAFLALLIPPSVLCIFGSAERYEKGVQRAIFPSTKLQIKVEEVKLFGKKLKLWKEEKYFSPKRLISKFWHQKSPNLAMEMILLCSEQKFCYNFTIVFLENFTENVVRNGKE